MQIKLHTGAATPPPGVGVSVDPVVVPKTVVCGGGWSVLGG